MATQHLWFVPVLLLYGRYNIVRNEVRRTWREKVLCERVSSSKLRP